MNHFAAVLLVLCCAIGGGLALLFAAWFVFEFCEWIAHHWHRTHHPNCLRCVRRSIQGEDSPAGRFL